MDKGNETITVSSALISPASDTTQLTPAMTTVLWQIAAILDEHRVPASVADAVWLEVPAKRLRGASAQENNRWLRECLRRLTGQQIAGEYRGSNWGAVLLAEWHLEKGEEAARLLIPPAAVRALRAPETFARIEIAAIYRLSGRAARLYAALADKKRLDRPAWEYSLEELRRIFGVEGRYSEWRDFRKRILDPALESINQFGTVIVSMTTIKQARKIVGVRFAWRWKSLDEARVATEEGELVNPYDEHPAVGTAPPLAPGTRDDRRQNEQKWWAELPAAERDRWQEKIRQDRVQSMPPGSDLAAELALALDETPRRAWEAAHPDELPYDELPE